MEDLSQRKRVVPDCDDVMEDSPSKKTSEIKPTANGVAKVLNDTMDDSLQGRRVTPDCDDMTPEIAPTEIEDTKVFNGTIDDSLQGKQVAPENDDTMISALTKTSETKTSETKPSGVELQVCSCLKPEASSSQDPAWKAIENGNISALKQAIQEMKESKDVSGASLNTCRLMEKSGVAYSVSLLALCGFHGRKEMVDLLLKEGAGLNSTCACVKHTGTPILQMMVHCLMQDQCHKLNVTMLQYFKERGAKLGGEITTLHFGLYCKERGGVKYGMLDLSLSMKRIDFAKVLVQEGVDLINGGCPSGEEFAVVPMFQEYRDHGTNEFICWAFNEYIPNHPEVDLEQIIHSLINMKKKDKKPCFWQSVQRAPAHAILTSHHEETILRLVKCSKDDFNGLDLLAERSCTGKTALHVAAENNDVYSVHILLQLGADTRASDKSGMNPFMIAVEKNNLEVVTAMMDKDPGLMLFQIGSGSRVFHWALEKGHQRNAFFKAFFEKDPKGLLTTKDSQGNTIAHLVAASGNTEVFEMLWSEEFAEAVFSGRNSEGKTPLQLAVENGHVNILETLKACVDGEREAIPPLWHRKLKTDWWNKVVPYFLYAASCGSLVAVKCFIASGHEPNIRWPSQNGKTPLLCAAEAGHDEIVAYLLQFEKVRTDLESESGKVYSASESPLLIAAQNGHTKCVTLLLQNGGNVGQTDYKNRNCLMIATQNHQKATALAILSGNDGSMALKMPTSIHKELQGKLNLNPLQLFAKRDKNPTPLQLLVKEMPDLAEYVLNKCITQAEPVQGIKRQISCEGEVLGNHTLTTDQPVRYKFEYLDDMDKEDGNHILDCMIEHDRLELLQHPLVENFLFQKFWVMTFPLLLVNLLFYLTFLVTLNWFALVVPRPGPDSETCRESNPVTLNGATAECQGQTEGDQNFLTKAAIILCILSIFGLLVEFLQFVNRGWRYLTYFDNYLHLALYISTVTFIYGFGNDCWCSTPWQWQIGAFSVFLSWLNFIFILKYMPNTAIPINMFLSICVTFLKLIFLPIVLILAFGVPHYMVFVRTDSSSKEVGNLTAFRSPAHAVAKTLLQLVGEFDFEDTFNRGDLLYTPTTYILFITFLITMPVLFTNLLIGLAVGDTQEQKKKAEFTKLKVWVEFILERERSCGILRGLHIHCKRSVYYPKGNGPKGEGETSDQPKEKESSKNSSFKDNEHLSKNDFELTLFDKGFSPANPLINFFLKRIGKEYSRHAEIAVECKKRNDEIFRKVMSHTTVDDVREDISELKKEISKNKQALDVKDDITTLKEDVSGFQQKMRAFDVRDDITKLKEDLSSLKEEVAKLVQALKSRVEAAGSNK